MLNHFEENLCNRRYREHGVTSVLAFKTSQGNLPITKWKYFHVATSVWEKVILSLTASQK